jgi:membrane protein DedA with SNARE-associated domain
MHFILDHVRYFLQTYGYWAVLLALLGENAGIPLPGETILIFASFLAYRGENLRLGPLILVGIGACTMGDNLGYWIGRWGGRPLLERWKGFFRVSDDDIKAAEDFLRRHGSAAIFVARFIAGMRIIAGPLAGVLRMEWKRFLVANAAGAAVWVTVIACVGYFFGAEYEALVHVLKGVEISILALVVAAAWYFWRRQKKQWKQRMARRREAAQREP